MLKKLLCLALFLVCSSSFAQGRKLVKHCVDSGGWFMADVYTGERNERKQTIGLGGVHCTLLVINDNEDFVVWVRGVMFDFESTIRIPAREMGGENFIVTEIWGAIGSAGTNTTLREVKPLGTRENNNRLICVRNDGAFVVYFADATIPVG